MAAPEPPHPELVRAPPGPFGWLDARLLREEWFARLGPDATALLTLLALAADRRGASYYGRDRMGRALGLTRARIDAGLARLLELRLVAVRPWRDGHPDGVWQLLPLPPPLTRARGAPVPVADSCSGYVAAPDAPAACASRTRSSLFLCSENQNQRRRRDPRLALFWRAAVVPFWRAPKRSSQSA